MKKILLTLLLATGISAQAAEPWRLNLENKTEEVTLRLDLYEESITVPGMEMFGPMNGYMNGKGIYGVWTIVSFEINSDRQATLRLSNDLGSETQSIRLTQETDSTYTMDLQGGVVVKKVVNRKLAKIPARMTLTKK